MFPIEEGIADTIIFLFLKDWIVLSMLLKLYYLKNILY
jgi:hypothetical protein